MKPILPFLPLFLFGLFASERSLVMGEDLPRQQVEYDKDDEPSDFARQDWAMVKDTHFRRCVIPVSVLSLLKDCTFELCRFVDDPEPLVFATTVKRTIYLEDCQWNVKELPAEFIVEKKKLSEKP